MLTTFYRALPQSPTGFGFTALADPPSNPVLGFISATTSTGQLFLQLGTRYLPAFLPPLLRRFAQRPGLLLHCMQTVFYPLLQSAHAGQGADGTAPLPTAELLSIMVEPDWRSQGLGAQLLDRLVAECRARKLGALDVTVAADNAGAQRFYARHGFVEQRRFTLYGRPMVSYQQSL
ncbi:MAG: GNAT family N-acetyltransferase [Caldilinea sp. CFX5]|nr:GNAT family N-acetyltransferase [Caldilinea sp. CFX5]